MNNQEVAGWMIELADWFEGLAKSSSMTCTNELNLKRAQMWRDRAAQVEAIGWQPVESAPPFGTPVFVSGFIKNVPGPERWVSQAVQCVDDGKWYENDECENDSFYPPTHWMSLPEPPQDEIGIGAEKPATTLPACASCGFNTKPASKVTQS